jgi:hypothetical protein
MTMIAAKKETKFVNSFHQLYRIGQSLHSFYGELDAPNDEGERKFESENNFK